MKRNITPVLDQSTIVLDPEFSYLLLLHTWSERSDGGYLGTRHLTEDLRLHHFVLPRIFELDTDHINGNILDNRLKNLRRITRRANNLNTLEPRCTWHKQTQKWRARVDQKHLGLFSTQAEGIEVSRRYQKVLLFEALQVTREHNLHLTDVEYYSLHGERIV